jgi:hypothetical protein
MTFAIACARPNILRFLLALLLALFSSLSVATAAPPPKIDLANTAAGIYRGDVISDAGGSSKTKVEITVAKVGPNKVRVTSSYNRLPTFEVDLTKAQNSIQQASGDIVFLLDLAKKPNSLQVTVDNASWSGVRYKPDLADIAEGKYFGDVISDARGSSRSNVSITVTKIGPNRISISSDYPRLPTFEAKLTRAMNTIQMTGNNGEVFLLDLSKKPLGLDITIADASWSGSRTNN